MDESDTHTLPLLSTSTTTPLEISSESEPKRLPTFCLILTPIVILIPLLFVLAIFLPTVEHSANNSIDDSGPPKEDDMGNNSTPFGFEHQAPAPSTLFRFVNEEGEPLNPRNNAVYRELKRGTFRHERLTVPPSSRQPLYLTEVVANPSFHLEVSHDDVEFGQELQVTWHPAQQEGAMLDDHNIIMVLSCAHDSKSASDIAKNFVDAATLSQIKATHIQQNQLDQELDSNRWIIPNFPVIHSNTCQFFMVQNAMSDTHAPTTHYNILASKKISLKSSLSKPTAIHLGLSSNPNARFIQFTTGVAGGSVVEIAKRSSDPKAELQFVKLTGESTTYSAGDMCQSPANSEDGAGGYVNPGHLHTVKAEGLEYNSEYIYRVGLAAGQGVRWSEYFEFKTDHGVVNVNKLDVVKATTTFLAVSDQGVQQSIASPTPATAPSLLSEIENTKGQAAAKDVVTLIHTLIHNETISSIHHLGDLSYANGVGHVWDVYMNMIQYYASSVPITVGVGNHEYDHTGGGKGKDPSGVISDGGFQPYWGNFNDDSGGECGVPTSKRFSVPENGNGVFWYSFNQPLVHTITLSSEHNLTASSPQRIWLEQDLQKVNRTVTPWLVLEIHRPMYSPWQDVDATAVAIQYEIEDLLYKHNVDLVLSGHIHAYLRTCDGLFRGKCDSGGPMHILVGTGGVPLDGEWNDRKAWVQKYDHTHWGVGRASVLNAYSLRWQFVAVGNVVTDEVVIQRSRE